MTVAFCRRLPRFSACRVRLRLRWFLPVASACLLSVAAAAEQPTVNLFLLAGQSNMAGADSVVLVPPGFDPTAADLQAKFTTAPVPDGEAAAEYLPWGPIRPHAASPPGKPVHGPEVGFVRALDASGWRQIAIIKVYANFGRDVSTWPWAEGEPLFQEWTRFVDARVAELAQEGAAVRVCGFLWHQGIDDAIHGALAHQYQQNLTALIGSLRRRYATETTPFVLARSVNSRIAEPRPDPAGKSPMAMVRNAQVATAESVPVCAWINVDDLPNVNTHHFSAESQLEIGRRFATALLMLESRKTP